MPKHRIKTNKSQNKLTRTQLDSCEVRRGAHNNNALELLLFYSYNADKSALGRANERKRVECQSVPKQSRFVPSINEIGF
jgi:hypothetical protein